RKRLRMFTSAVNMAFGLPSRQVRQVSASKFSQWSGGTYGSDEQPPREESGPEVVIVHPLSTEEEPRQEIPIMVLTVRQWKLVEGDKLGVSAAPFGPSEIGRNRKYVFALPPRYNYGSATGWEEVEDILNGHPLAPIRPR